MSVWDDFEELFEAEEFQEEAVLNGVSYRCILCEQESSQSTVDAGLEDSVDLMLSFWLADFTSSRPQKNDIITYDGTNYRVADGVKIDSIKKMITIPLVENYG